MAFDPAAPHVDTPTSIGEIRIIMFDPDGDPQNGSIRYGLVVLDQNGDPMPYSHSSGDLEPHLTPAQKQGLVDFMAAMRALAVAEIIPTP